jgi:hypothetical protein
MGQDNRALDIFDMIADVVQAKQKAWRNKAACRGAGTDAFFPKQHHPALHSVATRTCAGCPVQTECKAEWGTMPVAMQRHGYWYGTTDKERRQQE